MPENSVDCVPFCIIERPYMIWGHDLASDNANFLERMDANLYFRTAHGIIARPDADSVGDTPDDDQNRKDVSSLSRLLWHHGIETLVMVLGAYMQAPSVAHAYLLKCKTEDATQLARLLLNDTKPRYNRLAGAALSLTSLLNGIHRSAAWPDHDTVIARFARALRNMLRDYADEKHRWEYNSIKHGLRAIHGRFAIAFGLEEVPGVPASPETMEMVGFSRDASFFDVAKPLRNASKHASKVHFLTEKVSVAWSLEKVLCELQLLSLMLHNTVSALRIAGGAAPGAVTFNKIADDEAFWEMYASLHAGNVPTSSFSIDVDARAATLPTDKQIFDSYGT